MKLTSFLLLWSLAGWSPFVANADQRAQVTLTLDEFEDLYSTAKLKDVYRKLQDQKQRNHDEHLSKLEQLKQQHQQEIFPTNFQVLEYAAIGNYNATAATSTTDDNNMAVFDMQMTIRVMGYESPTNEDAKKNQRWTKVPLVSNTTVASDWQVEFLEETDGSTTFTLVDPVTSPDVLLLRDNSQAMELATSRSGLFRIRYQAYRHVLQSRNNIHEMVMSQFLYPLSDFRFRVHHHGTSRAVREFSVQPVEAVWRVDNPQQEEEEEASMTDIRVTLPLTADRVEIRWIDVGTASGGEQQQKDASSSEEGTAEVAEEVPQVTAIHEVMHSVGEGTVRSSHILEYSSTSELSASPVLFALHGPNVRITSMEGHALQSWEIVDKSGADDDNMMMVRVTWKRSHLDTSAILLIHTETDLKGSQQEQVELPRIECQNVLRQVGHVGVTKDANVEVHGHSTTGGIAQCEPTEISSKLRLNMDRPIVLSYKYLNPQNASVVIDVLVHVAMETLEAAVDRLHYKAVVTETHTVHSLLLVLQSTKLQYLELFGLPESASMFTLLVNSVPAKPTVGGRERSILVPLLVGLDAEAANAGRSLQTSVELTYISTHDEPMNGVQNGTLSLAPPHIKLPISVVTTELRLPKRHWNYNFTGDFPEPGRELAFPLPSSYSYLTHGRVVEEDYQFSFKDDVWPDDDVKSRESSVKIVTPNTGRSFHFHRLLVVDTKLALDVVFSEPQKEERKKEGWWSRIVGSSGLDTRAKLVQRSQQYRSSDSRPVPT